MRRFLSRVMMGGRSRIGCVHPGKKIVALVTGIGQGIVRTGGCRRSLLNDVMMSIAMMRKRRPCADRQEVGGKQNPGLEFFQTELAR